MNFWPVVLASTTGYRKFKPSEALEHASMLSVFAGTCPGTLVEEVLALLKFLPFQVHSASIKRTLLMQPRQLSKERRKQCHHVMFLSIQKCSEHIFSV